jgi:hypothetical protein
MPPTMYEPGHPAREYMMHGSWAAGRVSAALRRALAAGVGCRRIILVWRGRAEGDAPVAGGAGPTGDWLTPLAQVGYHPTSHGPFKPLPVRISVYAVTIVGFGAIGFALWNSK